MFFGNESGTITLDTMEVGSGSSKGSFLLALNQLKGVVKTQVENDLLQASTSITGTADIEAGGKAFKLEKIELQEAVKRLHAPTLNKLVLQFWQDLGGLSSGQPEELAKAMQKKQAEVMAAMKQLLIYDPEYSVDTAVSYAGQEGTLAYSLATHGVTEQDLQAPDPRGALIGKVTAKASAKLPIGWLEKTMAAKDGQAAPQQTHQMLDSILAGLTGAGYVTREGDLLSSSALFDKGQLTINGKPLSLGALLGR
jgi:uncharacterized protein YdgA (DUF945 family)